MKQVTGYHFTGDTLRNGAPIPAIGEILIHDGPVVPCESGLHMSKEPFDALRYAPGPILHKVRLYGDIKSHGDPIDKYAGRKRVILASIDATNLLRNFARLCALEVIHLWDAPPVVREYLLTGNEDIRAAAGAAAWDAGGAAAGGAWYAARAAWYAAWDAAAGAAARAAADAAADAAWYAAQRAKLNRMVVSAFKKGE